MKQRVFRFLCLLVIVAAPLSSPAAQTADQLYSGARGAFTDGLWSASASQFSRLLREYPEDPRADSAAYMGAVAYYNGKEYRRCIDVLSTFSHRYPDSAWNRRVAYWEALSYYELEQWGNAASAFTRQASLTVEPAYRERSLFYLGVCYENLNKLKIAERSYETLYEEGRDYGLLSQALFRLGQIRLADNRPSEALESFIRLSYDYSDSASASDSEYWIAECRRRLGDDDEALESYRNFLSSVYRSEYRGHALLEAARLASAAGYHDEALAYLDLRDDEKPRGFDAGAAAVLRVRAVSYLKIGKLAEAREALTSILNNPLDAAESQSAAFDLAQTWVGTSMVVRAIPYLERASKGPDRLITADALFLSGTLLLGAGDTQGAVVLRSFADSFPEDQRREEALRYAVRAWKDAGTPDGAVDALNILVADFPDSDLAPEYLFLRAEIAFDSADFSDALRDYGTLTRTYPDSSWCDEAFSRIGYVYAERSEYIRAAEYYELAAVRAGGVSGSEDGRQAVYSAAVAYLNGGDDRKAIRLFDSLLQSNPKGAWSVEAAYHKGEALYEAGEYSRAREAYENAARYGDASWTYESYYAIGWTWFRAADWEKSAVAFRKAAGTAPDRERASRAEYRVGLSLASAGDWDTALEEYESALNSPTGSWREEALYQKAWALLNLGREDDAFNTSDELAREFPRSELPADLPFRMGETALAAGNYTDALKWYDRCVADYPDTPIAIRSSLRAALAAKESGDWEHAAKRYGDWTLNHSGDPGAAGAARSWAEALKSGGDPTAAEIAMKRVKTAGLPNSVAAAVVLAWVRMAGTPSDSTTLLEEYVQDQTVSSSDRAEALFLTAQSYAVQGRQKRARDIYELVVRDVPGRLGAEAQEALGQSYAAEGRIDDAAEAFLAVPYLFADQKDISARALRAVERLYRESGREGEADKVREQLEEL